MTHARTTEEKSCCVKNQQTTNSHSSSFIALPCRRINPAENIIVSLFAMGEGWHNYHHVFPWDYKAAELPYKLNATTILIHLFEKIGWAYDLKEPSKDLIKRTIERHGDGSYANSLEVEDHHHHHHMPEVDYEEARLAEEDLLK